MRRTAALFIVMFASVSLLTGCGEKKEAPKAAAPMEKPVEQAAPAAAAPAATVVTPAATAPAASAPATPAATPTATQTPSAQPDMSAKGAEIFKTKCMACHGAGGKGSPMAPAFIGNAWIKSASKQDISGVIKNGRQGANKRYKEFAVAMPSNAGLSDADLGALADYLKSIN